MIRNRKPTFLLFFFVVCAVFIPQAHAERPIRILSIDGGGVRGVIPATILNAIEKETGKKTTELFDVMVGTSTGGLIVLFLNIPDADGKAKYTATDVMKIYKDLSSQIFKNPVARVLRTLGGLIGAKYSAKPFEALLKQYFGELRMSNTVNNVTITSMDSSTNTLFPFSTYVGKKSNLYNRYMWEAGRATSAAPTFFKPLELDLAGFAKLTLVDGGVGANNPGILGVIEAKKIYPDRELVLVSIGTGVNSELGKVSARGNLAGGMLQMLRPVIAGLFSGQNQLSDQAALALVGSSNFYRINPEIDADLDNVDNAKPENLKALEDVGLSMVNKDPTYKRLITMLKQGR